MTHCNLLTPKSHSSSTASQPTAETYESRVILALVNPAPPPKRKSAVGGVWSNSWSLHFLYRLPDSAAAWLARRLTGRLQRGKVNRRLDGQWQWRGTHPPARPAGSTPSSFPPYTRPHSLTSLETGLKVEQLGRGVCVGGGAMGLQLGVVGEGSPPPKNVTLLCPKIDILTCTRHQPGLHGGLLEPYQYKVYSSWYRCCHPKQMMP